MPSLPNACGVRLTLESIYMNHFLILRQCLTARILPAIVLALLLAAGYIP